LYISISGEDKILSFTINPETGALKALGEVVVSGRPSGMAISPNREFIYVGRKGNKSLSTFLRNLDTGELTLIGTTPVEMEPDWVAVDRKGKFLFSTYFQEGKMAVYPIGSDGTTGKSPLQWINSTKGLHSVQTDPSNKFAFLPHIAGVGPNIILQFKFDEVTGQFTPNNPDRVIPDVDAGPRHFCFHPKLDIAYFMNEEGSSVTAYRLNHTTGTLSPLQTVSTIPDDCKLKNRCADIQISPSGESLYVSNRGFNSIACYSVQPRTGQLTPAGYAPADAETRSFNFDPDGNFLYAAGLATGRLVSYRVNRATSELQQLEALETGKEPWWVLVPKPPVKV
jgi:6-phosphogluconolactonase